MKQRIWLWIVLFSISTILIVLMTTNWNLTIYTYYESALMRMREMNASQGFESSRVYSIGMNAAFVIVLSMFILFFIKLMFQFRINQLQSDFIAQISHEIKTPLTTLELSSSLLKKDLLQGAEKEILWKAHDDELHRLREEFEEILETAKLDSGKVPINFETFNIYDELVNFLTAFREGSTFEINFKSTHNKVFVHLDKKKFETILRNILQNAKKYGNSKVDIELSVTDQKYLIKIQDDGVGFEPKFSKKIFKRFFRLHENQRKTSGVGLGLYIADRLAKILKIKLSAESKGQNCGATFKIEGRVYE